MPFTSDEYSDSNSDSTTSNGSYDSNSESGKRSKRTRLKNRDLIKIQNVIAKSEQRISALRRDLQVAEDDNNAAQIVEFNELIALETERLEEKKKSEKRISRAIQKASNSKHQSTPKTINPQAANPGPASTPTKNSNGDPASSNGSVIKPSSSSSSITTSGGEPFTQKHIQQAAKAMPDYEAGDMSLSHKNGLTHHFDKSGTTQTLNFTSESDEDVIRAMIKAQFEIQKAQGGTTWTDISISSIVIDGASFDNHNRIAEIAKEIGFTNINVGGKNFHGHNKTARLVTGNGQLDNDKIGTVKDESFLLNNTYTGDPKQAMDAYAKDVRVACGLPVEQGALGRADATESKDNLLRISQPILDDKGILHLASDLLNFTEERDLQHYIGQYNKFKEDSEGLQTRRNYVAIAAFHEFKNMDKDDQLDILKSTDKDNTPYDFTKLKDSKNRDLRSAIRAGAFLAYHSQQYQLDGDIPTSENSAKRSLRGAKSQSISTSVLKSLKQHGISARLLNKALAERAIVDTTLDNLKTSYTGGLTDIGPVATPGDLGLTPAAAPAPAPALKVDKSYLTEMDRYDLRAQTLARIAEQNALKNPSSFTLDNLDLQDKSVCKKFLHQLTGIDETSLKSEDICPWSVQRVLTHMGDEEAAKTMARCFDTNDVMTRGLILNMFETLDPKITTSSDLSTSSALIAKFKGAAPSPTAQDVIARLQLNDSTAKQDVRQWITNKALEKPQDLMTLFQAASEPTDAKRLLSVFDDAGEEYEDEQRCFFIAKGNLLESDAPEWRETPTDYSDSVERNNFFTDITTGLKECTLTKEIEPSKPKRICQALKFLQNSNLPGPGNYFIGKIKNALEYASQEQLKKILTEVLQVPDAAKALRELYTPAPVALAPVAPVAPGTIRAALVQGIFQATGAPTPAYASADNFAVALYTASSQTHTTTMNTTTHGNANTMIATLKLYDQHSCVTIKDQALRTFKEQLGLAAAAELLAISKAINTDPTAKSLLTSTPLYPHCSTLNDAITQAIETPSQANSQAVCNKLGKLNGFNASPAVRDMHNATVANDISSPQLKDVFDLMQDPDLADRVKNDLQIHLHNLNPEHADLNIIKMAFEVSSENDDAKLSKILQLDTGSNSFPIPPLVKAIIQTSFKDITVKTKLLRFAGHIQLNKIKLGEERLKLEKATTDLEKSQAMKAYFIAFARIQDNIQKAHELTLTHQGSPNNTLTNSYREMKAALYREISQSTPPPAPDVANEYCRGMIKSNLKAYGKALTEGNVHMQSFALDQLKDIVEFMESVGTTESDKLRRHIFESVFAMNNDIVEKESQSINSKMKKSIKQTLEQNGGQALVCENVIDRLNHGDPTPNFSKARPSDLTIIVHTVTKQREAAIQCYKLLEKQHNALSKIFGEIDSPVNKMIATEVNMMIATDKAKHKDMIQQCDKHIKIVQAEIDKRTPRSSSRRPTSTSSSRISDDGGSVRKSRRNRSRPGSLRIINTGTTTDNSDTSSSRDSSDDEDDSSTYSF